ncbi:MAG: RagB/SusD family nutrient uptake outer membrane protein [Flavobacteriaceae bacterium]
MNNKFFNVHLYRILFVVIYGLFTSCEDFVEVEVPNHKIVSKTVFNSDNTANSALVGIYNELFRSYLSGGGRNSIQVLAGLTADNLQTAILDNDLIEFEQNEISVQNTSNLNLWSSAYNIIYMCNATLDGLEESEGVSSEMKAKLRGEARFVRAFVYFYLVNLYGEVPLIQTSDYRKNASAPRNSIEEIYALIIYDLERAIAVLGDTYDDGERLRPNKFAAMALLARVYLYLKDWEKAEVWSTQVIGSTENYALINDLDAVFLANSREAIWQVSPVGSGSALTHTKEGNLFIILEDPDYATPLSLSTSFVATFPDQDFRANSWINTFSSENITYHYPYKYKIKYASSGDIKEYSMVLEACRTISYKE